MLSGDDVGGGIEILDPGQPTDAVDDEQVEPSSSGSTSTLGVLTAVALGLLVAVGVVRTGNTPAPEPPAPSVTTLPEPPDPAEMRYRCPLCPGGLLRTCAPRRRCRRGRAGSARRPHRG